MPRVSARTWDFVRCNSRISIEKKRGKFDIFNVVTTIFQLLSRPNFPSGLLIAIEGFLLSIYRDIILNFSFCDWVIKSLS